MNSLCQLAGTWGGQDPVPGSYAELKLNGWRALRVPCVDREMRLVTRGSVPIEGIGHIAHVLDKMQEIAEVPMVFDGEFVRDDGTGDTLASTKRWCETDWKLGGEAGEFFIFDCLPHAQWKRGGWDVPLYQRKAALLELLERARAAIESEWTWRPGSRGADADRPFPVRVVPHIEVNQADEIIAIAESVWSEKGEGLVVKDPDAPYRRNRGPAWLKVKEGQAWHKRYLRATT